MIAASEVRITASCLAPDGLIHADTLTPVSGSFRRTHVMVHGGMHSGTCWIGTPDGRPGWAVMLAEAGDRVICLDWPGVGRSGYVAPETLTSAFVVDRIAAAMSELDGELVLWSHSMSGPFCWKIAETLAKRLDTLVAIAPGPPGNIQPVAPVLEETDALLTVSLLGRPWPLPKDRPFPPSRDFASFKLIGGSTHFPDAHFEPYVAGLQGIPAALISERLNVNGSQLRLDAPERLHGTTVLVVTGENDPDHPYEVDAEIVAFLRDAGINASLLYLSEHGIDGNGHMLMLERNNRDIVDLIRKTLW